MKMTVPRYFRLLACLQLALAALLTWWAILYRFSGQSDEAFAIPYIALLVAIALWYVFASGFWFAGASNTYFLLVLTLFASLATNIIPLVHDRWREVFTGILPPGLLKLVNCYALLLLFSISAREVRAWHSAQGAVTFSKKNILPASFAAALCLAAIISLGQAGSRAVNSVGPAVSAGTAEVRYIDAKGPLNMRKTPDINGEGIVLIPDGAEVKCLGTEGPVVTLNARSGRWTKVEWNGAVGWAFGGFLSDTPPGGCMIFPGGALRTGFTEGFLSDSPGIMHIRLLKGGEAQFDFYEYLMIGTWSASKNEIIIMTRYNPQSPHNYNCSEGGTPANEAKKCEDEARAGIAAEYGKDNIEIPVRFSLTPGPQNTVVVKGYGEDPAPAAGKTRFVYRFDATWSCAPPKR